MKVVYDPGHTAHDPQSFLVRGQIRRSAEQPERATRLLDAARAAGHVIVAPTDFGLAPIAAVHSAEYLDFLANAHTLWTALDGSAPEILPNVHPAGGAGRPPVSYPRAIVGRAGYHMADTACPIGPGTWQAACRSAHVAVSAAAALCDGERVAYGLCRPPGHHAYADMAGGFCFLNNAGIAAHWLAGRYGRVAILDVDVHHGNGTQGMFWRRGDVFTVSVHADPADYYPFFWGYAHERGEGDGTGANLNLPLPVGSGDDAYCAAIGQALERIALFAPGALVVALGLDAHEADPLQGMRVTTPGFGRAASLIAAYARTSEVPVALIQEGGYLSDALGRNLVHFLGAFS